MTSYRDRHLAGLYEANDSSDEPEAAPLPRTHAELDELANERDHTWSSHELTVAEKQGELGG